MQKLVGTLFGRAVFIAFIVGSFTNIDSPEFIQAALADDTMIEDEVPESEEGPSTVSELIASLADRMYVIGETKNKLDNFKDAETQVVGELVNLIQTKEGASSLMEKDKNGVLPLSQAAFFGFSEVVRAMLQVPDVAAQINEVDQDGVSAWTFSMLAIRQTMWLCNPTVMADPFRWVPIYVVSPYYQDSAGSPYLRTRKLLEEHGAKPDLEAAKAHWNKFCVRQDEETKKKVNAASDIQPTLFSLSAESLQKLNSMGGKK